MKNRRYRKLNEVLTSWHIYNEIGGNLVYSAMYFRQSVNSELYCWDPEGRKFDTGIYSGNLPPLYRSYKKAFAAAQDYPVLYCFDFVKKVIWERKYIDDEFQVSKTEIPNNFSSINDWPVKYMDIINTIEGDPDSGPAVAVITSGKLQ